MLGNYSAQQFLAFAVEALSREDIERQAALNRALMDARFFRRLTCCMSNACIVIAQQRRNTELPRYNPHLRLPFH